MKYFISRCGFSSWEIDVSCWSCLGVEGQIKQWSRTRSHDGISDGEDGVRAHILRTTLGEHKQHCCSLLVSPTFHQDGICL